MVHKTLKRDKSVVICMVGKGFTPAQQAWPALTLEGHAQLMGRRVQMRVLGMIESLNWTNHANFTKHAIVESAWVSKKDVDYPDTNLEVVRPELHSAAVQTRMCGACGTPDTDARIATDDTDLGHMTSATACRQCGAGAQFCELLSYARCSECRPEVSIQLPTAASWKEELKPKELNDKCGKGCTHSVLNPRKDTYEPCGYPCQTRPDQTRPNQTRPDQTRPNQTKPDQTRPNQTKPDQTKPNQTKHSPRLQLRKVKAEPQAPIL